MFARPELEKLARLTRDELLEELVASLALELERTSRWRILRRVRLENNLELARFALYVWTRGRLRSASVAAERARLSIEEREELARLDRKRAERFASDSALHLARPATGKGPH